jgi:hypothetical protein
MVDGRSAGRRSAMTCIQFTGIKVSAIGYQLSAIVERLSVIGYQLSAIRLLAICHWLSGFGLAAAAAALSFVYFADQLHEGRDNFRRGSDLQIARFGAPRFVPADGVVLGCG